MEKVRSRKQGRNARIGIPDGERLGKVGILEWIHHIRLGSPPEACFQGGLEDSWFTMRNELVRGVPTLERISVVALLPRPESKRCFLWNAE